MDFEAPRLRVHSNHNQGYKMNLPIQWESYAGIIGIDWGDKNHAICMWLPDSREIESKLAHTPEAISEWAEELRNRHEGRFAVGLEQSRGSVCTALLEHTDVLDLYPVNPLSVHLFRKTWSSAGAKNDPSDARLICEMMRTHPDRMRPLRMQDPETQALKLLNEKRRKLVDLRTRLVEQLISQLKEYFPQALELTGGDFSNRLSCDFLRKWKSLQAVKRARPSTLRQFYYNHNCRSKKRVEERMRSVQSAVPLTTNVHLMEPMIRMVETLIQHISLLNEQIRGFDQEIDQTFRACEDAGLFRSFPGAGAALAPRLLAIFGQDRERWSDAEEVQKYTGIAPVVVQSGNSSKTQRRYARPRFDHQTFVEFARCSKQYCSWAAGFHDMKKSKGMGENAILRALAFKWLRIMYTCWKNHVPYDDEAYMATLRKKNSPCLSFIPNPTENAT
jgi:transposase